jgi:hypothetical protein
MLHKNEIGVCVDESVAYLLEEKNDENLITIIRADEIGEEKGTLRQKRRQKKLAFYRKVFELIQDFDKVSLFGSAAAKNEIIKQIRANKLRNIQIQHDTPGAEITENQKIDFISRYFARKT